MKKGGKALLTIGMATTMVIGTIGVMNITNMHKEENRTMIQAYNYTPANILDNVFTLNNNKYLPFIFNNTKDVITKTKIIQEFTKAGLEVESISCKEEAVGTGTTIKVKGSSEIYTVVVYGDVDGDGTVNVFDALRIVEHIATDNKITGTALQMAANVENGDNSLDVFDALRIVGVIAGEVDKLVVNEPEADPVNPGPGPAPDEDKEDPVITIGNKEVSVNFGATYQDNDNDVTASDNKDEDIASKVKREKIEFMPAGSSNSEVVTSINTNKIGTYTITYKVSDNSGNTATATRTITVKGLTSIKVGDTNETSLTLDLYVESKPNTENKDGNIYTMLPIKFYNQDGDNGGEIELKANDIQISSGDSLEGKIAIDLSNVNTLNDQKLLVRCYDVTGADTGAIEKIGFAMPLKNNENFDISQLEGKTITIKCRQQTITLTLKVNYKETRSFNMITETEPGDSIQIQGKNTDGNYVAGVNKEVTLAIIEAGSKWEKPMTQEIIDNKEITFAENFDTSKMEVKYVIENGKVLLKAKMKEANDTAIYTITPVLGGNTKTPLTIIGIPSEWNISIGEEKELENGMAKFEISFGSYGYVLEDFIVSNSEHPDGGQEVIVKEIKYEQKVQNQKGEYLNIKFMVDTQLTEANEGQPVRQILMQANSGLQKEDLPLKVVVTFTLFDQIKEVQYDKNIVVRIVE